MRQMAGRRKRLGASGALILLAAIAGAAALAASPAAAMRSKKVASHLCKTVGGGRFVAIPGFPGEEIDRRLLPDIRWMKRRFDIFITDGYSTDPVHAAVGEPPIGLATDIVPNSAAAGTWNEIGELAHLAEPRQDQPIMPWRWVGWTGDPGHGRGDHLHLSWSHSDTDPEHPARVVYTRRCPRSRERNRSDDGGHHHHHRGPTGGTGAGNLTGTDGSSGGTSAGELSPRIGKLAPIIPEDA